MDLLPIVEKVLARKESFLKLAEAHRTPFYVYDQGELDESIDRLVEAFQTRIPRFQAYYALKLNHHPFIVKRVVEKGLGLDVASKRELLIALEAGAEKIVYFSPGKSEEDLTEAAMHGDVVRIHIDSFNELVRLGAITNKLEKTISAGVRVNLPTQGLWSKYGIRLEELKNFFEAAAQYPFIKLDGIHVHQSRNRTADFYVNTIRDIGEFIKGNLSAEQRALIKYVDLGGGFEVHQNEGVILSGESSSHAYKILDVPTIEEYAQAIGGAIEKYLSPFVDATYLIEPGRYICNSAMHIVLRIADVKDAQNVILDGGVNMVGWQRFEFEYFPLVDLSSPATSEIECNMWGNLCTTWDIWGYRCYAEKLQEGDIIVVPNQGALTYSLAQNFINEIPPVYRL